jgi:hypothetical protein
MKDVSGKRSLGYLTRPWKEHPARGKEKLRQFLRCYYGGDDAKAKKAFAQIKSRGLGSLELLIISDLFDEWWNGEWKIEKRRFVRLKGERHRRKRKNWAKALPVIDKNRKEATYRFIKSFGPSSYSQYRRKT